MPLSSRMARAAAVLGAGLLALAGPAVAQQMPTMQSGMPEMASGQSELIRKLLPSVVNITTHKDVPADSGANAGGGTTESRRFYGTGFVIDPSGLIATNFHVVANAWQIDVIFNDGTQVSGHIFKATRLIDVAVIKVDVGHDLPPVRWGDSDKVQIGDPVFAVGNALGVGISVSGGIVSALNRDIMDSPYDDFIQTDAALNHGNSGGPLFNMQGEVIGIDSDLISPTAASAGVGFAIPSHSARTVIDRLLHYGWLRPGWIGVKVQQVTPDIARALRMKDAMGSIVANVGADGPAAKAGLRVGDVITRIGTGAPIDERALLRAIATAPIGENIGLVVWRDGAMQTLEVPVQEWPRNQWDALDAPVSMTEAHHHIAPDLGMTLTALDDATRARFGVTSTQPGVLVSAVAPGSDAAQRGLKTGDVLMRVQAKTVSSAAEAEAAVAAVRAEKQDFVLVLVDPKVHQTPGPQWVALRVADD